MFWLRASHLNWALGCFTKGVTNMLKWLFASLEKAIKDECMQRAVNEGCISSKVAEQGNRMKVVDI